MLLDCIQEGTGLLTRDVALNQHVNVHTAKHLADILLHFMGRYIIYHTQFFVLRPHALCKKVGRVIHGMLIWLLQVKVFVVAAHLVMHDRKALRIDLELGKCIQHGFKQVRQFVIVATQDNVNPIQMTVDIVVQASHICIVRVLTQRILDQFHQHA